jgi:hypothetical protein
MRAIDSRITALCAAVPASGPQQNGPWLATKTAGIAEESILKRSHYSMTGVARIPIDLPIWHYLGDRNGTVDNPWVV